MISELIRKDNGSPCLTWQELISQLRAAAKNARRVSTPTEEPLGPAWLNSLLLQNDSSPIYLTASLAREVFHHVAMNTDPAFAPAMPQILILTGVFGSGKTAGLAEALSRCGCGMIRVEAAEMESVNAGAPAKLVRERYLDAAQRRHKEGRPYTLILEDIHLPFGTDGNTTKTVNIDLTIATLMGLCDFPNTVRGGFTQRVPILATANDLTKVHGGLIRPGRTRVVAVEPSEAERKQIATHILRDLLSADQTAKVVDAQPTWALATFRQFKSELLRRAFDHCHRGKTAQHILQSLIDGGTSSSSINAADVPVTQEDIDRAVLAIDAETSAKRDFTGRSGRSEHDEHTSQ